MDIDPIAVNVARLRLWLTLCVEYETEDGSDPPPLPNLDFKIEQADSVLAATVSDLTPSGAEEEGDTRIEGPGAYRHLIPELDKLKAEYLREPYNKGPIRKKIAKLRETISSWIVNDQNNPAGIDFDWRIDFAEIFGIEDAPGFDIILANPPYVRMELIKPMKPHLKLLYPDFYAGRADLFTYFFARGMELLRQGGRLVFICSSTWTKTAAAKKLRDFLRERATVHRFLDFGDLPVFENVTTYPAIVIAERAKPPKDHEIRANRIKTVLHSELEQELHAPGILVPQRELDSGGWRFEDRRVARLRQKIQDAGVPLKDYCGSPLYGIKTGLNKAFVIDQQKRDALVAADPRSEEILKPFLEGKDLKPWRANWRGLWLIYTIHGIEISNYPAIENHLRPYKQRLEERATSHLHPWHELQQPQFAYSKAFAKPKIIFGRFMSRPLFAFDRQGAFHNDALYFLPTGDLFILGWLMSDIGWFVLRSICTPMRGGFYQAHIIKFLRLSLPIAQAGKADARKIAALAEALSEGSGGVSPPNVGQDAPPPLVELEEELNDRVAALYGLTPQERKIIEQSGR